VTAIYIEPDSSLLDAIRAIEASSRRMVVVLSAAGKLLGTVTDGDIRRCLLTGGSLASPISDAMNTCPITVTVGSASGFILDQMKKGNVLGIPVLDKEGRFIKIIHLNDLESDEEKHSAEETFEFAVIMAGGEGTRLRPLTLDVPKPMVEVGGVPLIERQVEKLIKAGLKRIYISVNYLSEIIEEHFGNGEKHGIEIRYLREKGKLGTAGSLGLLPEKPKKPIVVMNGDILTTSDFQSLHAFHCAHKADLTVAAIDYRVEIPYGVIQSKGAYVVALKEKPSQQFLCNAGIYALSPKALDLIESVEFLNMTDIIEHCIETNRLVAVFPIHEYWSDIGTPADLEKAREYISTGLQQ
jgi:dTDP-glucose pyrophosphorylase